MEKKKSKKLPVILLLIFLAVCFAAVYIRVNPRWTPAKLTIEPLDEPRTSQWIDPEGATVESRLIPPEGYTRVPAEEGSFEQYLRSYPLLPDNTKLPVFDGSVKDSPYTAAVFDITVGDEGYQQCADSIIRLYSDYFYENGRYDRIDFQFSNGDDCNYERWRKGKRMLVLGDFSCEIPAALPDDSEQGYRNYLKEVMNYAGTLSMLKESRQISAADLQIGDIVIDETHVVMVVDMAVNEKGEKCYLFGQSFIPAVCFHIVNNIDGGEATPWFTQEYLEQNAFKVGGFTFFSDKDIRRPDYNA